MKYLSNAGFDVQAKKYVTQLLPYVFTESCLLSSAPLDYDYRPVINVIRVCRLQATKHLVLFASSEWRKKLLWHERCCNSDNFPLMGSFSVVFLLHDVHCGIWDWCIVGFVQQVSYGLSRLNDKIDHVACVSFPIQWNVLISVFVICCRTLGNLLSWI